MTPPKTCDHFLDITGDVCPMTFVKTKLMVESMSVGETLEVRLNGGEPLENVPRSLRELGHQILDIGVEDPEAENAVYILCMRK